MSNLTNFDEVNTSAFADRVHVQFGDWTKGRAISTVGTNNGARALPFQMWRRFKEAFTPEIVERALNETPGNVRHIVDPFGGSGTTALAAQFLGAKPTVIEVNPFLSDLIEAKIASINFDIAAKAFGQVIDLASKRAGPRHPVFRGAPVTFVEPGYKGRYIFSLAVARRLLTYREIIEEVEDTACKRLFRVILASTTIPASNVIVSGKGRRYRKGWENRCVEPTMIDELFRKGVLQALYDLRLFEERKNRNYRVLRGDARVLADQVGVHDLAVFSPPYPNSFDYTDVYNVELWALGYLNCKQANRRLRSSTVRSHVQVPRTLDYGEITSPTLKTTIEKLCDVRDKLWNRNIPEMIGAYTKDMMIVLKKLATGMRSNGRIYMIVGDSRYAGVDVSVATVLTEIAPTLGFEVHELEPCRSMRSSPQQGGKDLRETLIVFKRC